MYINLYRWLPGNQRKAPPLQLIVITDEAVDFATVIRVYTFIMVTKVMIISGYYSSSFDHHRKHYSFEVCAFPGELVDRCCIKRHVIRGGRARLSVPLVYYAM